mgnify:CR=1 FL=1
MRGILATLRSAFADIAARPLALAAKASVMMVNDAVWVVFWLLFFDRVKSMRGWDADSMMLLQAVLVTAGGLTLGLFANARRIGQLATDGGLDEALSLPVPTLAYLLVRRVDPVNLGDVAFGLLLFAVLGNPTPRRAAVFVVVVLAACTILTGFLVLTGSLSFFIGRNEGGELAFHAMVLLGSYPVDVFGGWARVVLFTVVPAAFVAAVPARLVAGFDTGRAIGLGTAAVVMAAAAILTFRAGLRRYTSGSAWTTP